MKKTKQQLRAFTVSNAGRFSLASFEVGAANGYVYIPQGHPSHGKPYDSIKGISVHGGLTFGELVNKDLIKAFGAGKLSESDIGGYVVGFDTCHYGDTPENWPTDKVMEEAEKLKAQLAKKRTRKAK